jgi:hypothetical protein
MYEERHAPPRPTPRDVQEVGETQRPALVTLGAAVLIAFGSFAAVVGLALVAIGIIYQNPAILPTWADLAPSGLGATGYLVGVIGLTVGVGQTAAGIGALRGDAWARIVGVLLAMVGAAAAALGVTRGGAADAGGITTIFVPVAAAYLYAAWALAIHARWFARR